jgi:hypothetical protein
MKSRRSSCWSIVKSLTAMTTLISQTGGDFKSRFHVSVSDEESDDGFYGPRNVTDDENDVHLSPHVRDYRANRGGLSWD